MNEQPLHSQLSNLNIDPTIHERIKKLPDLTINEIDLLKTEIESEHHKNFSILKEQNLTMESPLVTSDGFPDPNIDVLQIRLVKRNINMLRNDLNNVITTCALKLNRHFGKDKNQNQQESLRKGENFDHIIPFAQIYDVIEGGPIFIAGCLSGDELVLIGNLNAGTYLNLNNISNYILQNENKKVTIRIRRDKKLLDMILIPTRQWNGQGLLGCKLKLL